MNTKKAMISVCTCLVALITAPPVGASTPDSVAAATEARTVGPQRERIQDLLFQQGLPSARCLAHEITQELVGHDGSVPGKATLRAPAVPLFAAAHAPRPTRQEPVRGPAANHGHDDRPGPLSLIRKFLARFLEFLTLSG